MSITRDQANEIKRLAGLYAGAPYLAAFSQEYIDAQSALHRYIDSLICEPSSNAYQLPGWRLVPEKPTPEICDALRVGSRRDVPSDQLCEVRYRAMLAAAPTPPVAAQKCMCRACLTPVEHLGTFVVCSQCGNKRCPKADDHRNTCSGSNDPGQPASTPEPPPEYDPEVEKRAFAARLLAEVPKEAPR